MNEATQYTEYIPYIRFLLGMLIVAAVAGMSFNRPSWARTYTVFVRYAASAFLFIFCQVAIYYVLILVAPYIVRSLTSSAQTPLAVFSSTLVSVLLTVFIAQHSLIDRTLRNALHNLAGIPDVALKLTQTLSDAQFHANEEETRNAKLLLLRRGIDSDQEWLAPAQGSQELFLKATIVYLKVKQWHEHGSYSVFLEEVSHDFDRLRERFDRISLKFSRTLSQIERLGNIKSVMGTIGSESLSSSGVVVEQHFYDEGIDEKFKKVINDMLLDLHEDVSAFYRALCRLLARWALSCHLTSDDCMRQLRLYGYELAGEFPRPSFNALGYAAVVMLSSVALFFLIVAHAPIATLSIPAVVILITIIQIGALAIAIVPKLMWGFANAGINRRTPIPFVLGAGLAAMLFSVLVNLIAGALRMKGWQGIMERLIEAAPYLPSAFATAAATGFLVQDHRWGFLTLQSIRRLYDATFMGLVWLATSFASTWLAAWLAPTVTTSQPQNILVGALFAFMVGFAIGYIVPGSFRETMLVSLPLIGTVDLRLRQLQKLKQFLLRASASKAHHHTISQPRAGIGEE